MTRLVSCYALFKGWLLLSQPPRCLSHMTPFLITLSPYLGTLTWGWVAFPFAPRAYPCGPHTHLLRRLQLRSLIRCRALSGPKHLISHSTSQAISGEVYLRVVSGGTSHSRPRLAFHPYPQVIRTICTSASVRSSTPLSEGFNLPRDRSAGFGSPTSDSGRTHPVPHPYGLWTFAFAPAT